MYRKHDASQYIKSINFYLASQSMIMRLRYKFVSIVKCLFTLSEAVLSFLLKILYRKNNKPIVQFYWQNLFIYNVYKSRDGP